MILDINTAYILPENNFYALYEKDFGLLIRKVAYWANRGQVLEGLFIEPGEKPQYCEDQEGFVRYFDREELSNVIK